MANANAEIQIQGRLHDFGWVILPIKSGPFVEVEFVLDTSYPLTRISEGTFDVLQAFGMLTALTDKSWRIHGLHVQNRALPNIDVRVSRVVSRLGLEAMLGLNFLASFQEVCFHRPSAVLTLRR